MRALNSEGKELLGKKFYCTQLDIYDDSTDSAELVEDFAAELIKTLEIEEKKTAKFSKNNFLDYVVCGGCTEGNKLKKEVCFSDAIFVDGDICRIPGNKRGADWSTVSTHGWFSYEIKLAPNCENIICVTAGCESDILKLIVTTGDEEHIVEEKVCGKKELLFTYNEKESKDSVRIRIDRNSVHTPYIFSIAVKSV